MEPPRPDRDLPQLYADLPRADRDQAIDITRQIELHWTRTGSVTLDLLLRRGQDALDQGAFAAATEHFTALLDHDPGFAPGYLGRAKARIGLEKFGPALADLETALALDGQNYQAILVLGMVLERAGNPRKAWEAYRLALARHPHYDEAEQAAARLEPRVGDTPL